MSLVSDLNLLLASIALLASSTMTSAARHIALRMGVLDEPDKARKIHRHATPLLGGLALFGAILTTILVGQILPNTSGLLANLQPRVLSMLLISGGLFCLLGLYDDIRPMRPWHKFGYQFLAALPFAIWGQNVVWIEFLGYNLTLGAIFGTAMTAIWLVACANTINLIDGLDGLAGSVGLIACVGIALVADFRSFPGVAAVAIIVSASLAGFLCHNLPPARIFLGDSGSLLIGFLIGALSIEASLKTATGFAMTVPLILVSIPVFDTVMAIIRRRLTGRGIGEADRGHIHHRLQERGLSRLQTLLVIAGLCTAMTALTVLAAAYRADRTCALLCLGMLGLLMAGRVFGHHETLLLFRRAQSVGRLLFERFSSGNDQPRIALEDHASATPPTWEEVIERVRPFGVCRLELAWFDLQAGRNSDQRTWNSETTQTTWELRVSARSTDHQQLLLAAFGNHTRSSASEQASVFGILDECARRWAALGALPESNPFATNEREEDATLLAPLHGSEPATGQYAA